MFRLRQIGVKGSPWAESMLANAKKKHHKPELDAVNAAKPQAEAQPVEPVKQGSKWFVPGNPDGFKTKKAAKAWLAEQETE